MSKKAKIVRCSHALAPFETGKKCAWTGRADKYDAHLAEFHGGEEYEALKVGKEEEV